MKKLLLLTSLFITAPTHAAFDLEGMLEDIVKEGVNNIVNSVGQQSSLTPEELIKLIASNDKKAQEFILENNVDFNQKKEINTILVACRNFTGKYIEATELCANSNKLATAEGNMKKVEEISALHQRIKTNIDKHNRYIDSFGRDDINQVEAIIKDSQLLEAKLNEYQHYRTYPSVQHVIAQGKTALAKIENKQAKTALNEKKADKKRKAKATKAAKAQRQAEAKAGLSLMTKGIFKKPYAACLTEGEKLIDIAKLLNSKSMTPEKVKEARATAKEHCGCVYVSIHNNSVNASKRRRSALADDLTKLEKAKIKNSERKMSKWEAKMFQAGFNDADVMGVAYMDAMLKCQ